MAVGQPPERLCPSRHDPVGQTAGVHCPPIPGRLVAWPIAISTETIHHYQGDLDPPHKVRQQNKQRVKGTTLGKWKNHYQASLAIMNHKYQPVSSVINQLLHPTPSAFVASNPKRSPQSLRSTPACRPAASLAAWGSARVGPVQQLMWECQAATFNLVNNSMICQY